ncbi:elongation of very long chain fatty acids protein 4-like [Anneissia japonica]|uniref:elongation of very long chain fatty acids protein 4-like n=1 Tax=Anneissia japonica TaxID=1529436 RepID=UPI0014257F14|nr:elongation of very long chain fatty acids protein 4-like [Anneissia japonica]
MDWLVNRGVEFWSWAESVADVRTKHWFLIPSPYPSYTIAIVYLLGVWYGPKIMENYKPFKLNRIMVTYNACLILLNAFVFKEFLMSTVFNPDFDVFCNKVDYSNDPQAIRLANATWWFFFSKIIELTDTVFFILRKKHTQISFLHVYHHSTMVMLWWVGVRWVAGGNSYMCATVNTFIHVVMYGYYLLSACGPAVRKHLWWKKYLTSLQLAQFVFILMHTLNTLRVGCDVRHRPYMITLTFYLISHIVLFADFFRKTYITKKLPKAEQNGHSNGTNYTETHNGNYNLRERPRQSSRKDN